MLGAIAFIVDIQVIPTCIVLLIRFVQFEQQLTGYTKIFWLLLIK